MLVGVVSVDSKAAANRTVRGVGRELQRDFVFLAGRDRLDGGADTVAAAGNASDVNRAVAIVDEADDALRGLMAAHDTERNLGRIHGYVTLDGAKDRDIERRAAGGKLNRIVKGTGGHRLEQRDVDGGARFAIGARDGSDADVGIGLADAFDFKRLTVNEVGNDDLTGRFGAVLDVTKGDFGRGRSDLNLDVALDSQLEPAGPSDHC